MYFDLLALVIKDRIYKLRNGIRAQENNAILMFAEENHLSKLCTFMDMAICFLKYGATFKEYYNLDFYHRADGNRRTLLTTGVNIRAYNKLNSKSLNHIYINKDEFNMTYADFIGRSWIPLNKETGAVIDFFRRYKRLIIKPIAGDSGSQIRLIENTDSLPEKEILNICRENKCFLAEEVLGNHPEIGRLNSSSLNTIRIITVLHNNSVEILYAGIRIGAPGSVVDNISKGGRVAPIDIESGKVFACASYKKTVNSSDGDSSVVGFQIPEWTRILCFTRSVALVVPEMSYMAWDIALTPAGPALIEGNHSSGNTVSQIHIGVKDIGLKARLDEITKGYGERIWKKAELKRLL